jgi:hypothetical protein
MLIKALDYQVADKGNGLQTKDSREYSGQTFEDCKQGVFHQPGQWTGS